MRKLITLTEFQWNAKKRSFFSLSRLLSLLVCHWKTPKCTNNLKFTQARNQLGTPGGEEWLERGPNFLNYVQ